MPEAGSIAVTGYGAVGRAVVAQLLARGTKVTLVQRSKPAGLPKGVAFKTTDLEDPKAAIEACKGVEAVICATGLPYTVKAFSQDWPVVMTHLLAGCAASGARFVFADNLYMYGPQTAPLREDMPLTIPRGLAISRRRWSKVWRKRSRPIARKPDGPCGREWFSI